MTYALLIHLHQTDEPTDHLLPEVLERHRALQADLKTADALLGSARLDDAPAAPRVVRPGPDQPITAETPSVGLKEWLAGFYLVSADSEEEAMDHARRICPHAGHVEVREVRWMYEG